MRGTALCSDTRCQRELELRHGLAALQPGVPAPVRRAGARLDLLVRDDQQAGIGACSLRPRYAAGRQGAGAQRGQRHDQPEGLTGCARPKAVGHMSLLQVRNAAIADVRPMPSIANKLLVYD